MRWARASQGQLTCGSGGIGDGVLARVRLGLQELVVAKVLCAIFRDHADVNVGARAQIVENA
jgi:hypothetical protein